ncbi:MAG: AbrB/MazE/SpoVT family DNA-binding domain-containing protein [Candidatus Bathyarchaeia archaeon]|jgi:AbrB family looped-hinge helix DNA binding protein
MNTELKLPALTRASSKGQIVIPAAVRKKLGVKEGSVFAVTTKKDMIVLKKLDSKIKAEDLRTLKLIEEAWKDIEEGRYKAATPDEFFKELDKWKK